MRDEEVSLSGRRYWIVGASEGLGRALAQQLSRMGVDLVLSARDGDRLDELVEGLSGHASALPMDVTDPASVEAAVARLGAIDGLIWMAGTYAPVSARKWDCDKVEAMCEVNLTGAARVIGRVLPAMVERDSGHLVLTGSLAGFRGLPGAVGYAATKAGVMSLAESIHADLRGTGVRVQLVNPGFVKTRLTDKNDFHMPFLMQPETAAREIVEHMLTGGFSKSFPLGFSLVFRLARFLPDWAYYRIFA